MRSISIDDLVYLFEQCMQVIPYRSVRAWIGGKGVRQAEEGKEELVGQGV